MSLAASLDHANEGTIAASERARPRIVGPGGATAAVDEQERSDAEAEEQARLAAIEAEAQRALMFSDRHEMWERLAELNTRLLDGVDAAPEVTKIVELERDEIAQELGLVDPIEEQPRA